MRHTDARVDLRSKERTAAAGTKPGNGNGSARRAGRARQGRKRGARVILNSKYAHRVTSALVSQKICCLQARARQRGVFARRVQMHPRRAHVHKHITLRTYRESGRCRARFSMWIAQSPVWEETCHWDADVGHPSPLASFRLLHFKGRHATRAWSFLRLRTCVWQRWETDARRGLFL